MSYILHKWILNSTFFTDELINLQIRSWIKLNSYINYEHRRHERPPQKKDKQRAEKLHLIWEDVDTLNTMQLITALSKLVDTEWYDQMEAIVNNKEENFGNLDFVENLSMDIGM